MSSLMWKDPVDGWLMVTSLGYQFKDVSLAEAVKDPAHGSAGQVHHRDHAGQAREDPASRVIRKARQADQDKPL